MVHRSRVIIQMALVALILLGALRLAIPEPRAADDPNAEWAAFDAGLDRFLAMIIVGAAAGVAFVSWYSIRRSRPVALIAVNGALAVVGVVLARSEPILAGPWLPTVAIWLFVALAALGILLAAKTPSIGTPPSRRDTLNEVGGPDRA